MTTMDKLLPPRDSWMPAFAMLTVALVTVAAMLNGVGPVGVMASAHSGDGHYVELPALSSDEQIDFSRVDRTLSRLDLTESGRPGQFEEYEGLLLDLAEALPADPGVATLARVGQLLARSLPAPAANELMDILPTFLAYRRAEDSLLGLTPGAPRSIEGAWLHLQLQDALRRTILGEELTTKLYSNSYRMMDMHMVRQMLMQREDLGEEEKRQLIREQMEAFSAQRQQGGAG